MAFSFKSQPPPTDAGATPPAVLPVALHRVRPVRSDNNTRERNRDHEADDQHERLRRRRDAGARRVGRGPQGRVRARRMGHAVLRRGDRGLDRPGLPARRRLPVRPADLRGLRRLLGNRLLGANQGDNPISVALNTRPKYVASNTLTDPQWAHTTVLSGDVAAAVGELKAKPGGELQVVGSLSVVRLLLENDLVDELILLTYPVVVGQGRRLFPDTGQDLALELVESGATTNGVILQDYRTAGRPQYG